MTRARRRDAGVLLHRRAASLGGGGRGGGGPPARAGDQDREIEHRVPSPAADFRLPCSAMNAINCKPCRRRRGRRRLLCGKVDQARCERRDGPRIRSSARSSPGLIRRRPTGIRFRRPTSPRPISTRLADCVRSGWLTAGREGRRVRGRASPSRRREPRGRRLERHHGRPAPLRRAGLSQGRGGDLPRLHLLRPADDGLAARPEAGLRRLPAQDPADRPVDVARRITPRTVAVVPTHMAGAACDLEALGRICAEHGLDLIDDAAHAFPTRHRGRILSGPTRCPRSPRSSRSTRRSRSRPPARAA